MFPTTLWSRSSAPFGTRVCRLTSLRCIQLVCLHYSHLLLLLVLVLFVTCTKHGKLETWKPLQSHSTGYFQYRVLQYFFLYSAFVFPGYVSEVAVGFSLEGHTGLFFGARFGCDYWLFLDFLFRVTARAIKVSNKFENAPGPFAAEERCFIRGDWRSTWSAERQVCVLSVSLLYNNNFPLSFNNSPCSVEQFLRNWLSTRSVMDVSPGLVTGTYTSLRPEIDCHSLDVSALGENFDATPMVLPTRGCLDSVKRLLKGDLYIGRGSRQRSLAKSRYCNTFKVSEVGRDMAIEKFRDSLLQDQALHRSLWTLSGRRLTCHCRLHEKCHGDVLIQEFSNSYPQAYDRTTKAGSPADSRVLNLHVETQGRAR